MKKKIAPTAIGVPPATGVYGSDLSLETSNPSQWIGSNDKNGNFGNTAKLLKKA